MTSENPAREELIGRLLRYRTADKQRLSFIDAELSSTAALFKKASSQLEALLANQPAGFDSVLSRIDMDHILKLLAERAELERRMIETNEQLRKLIAQR